LHDVSLLSDAYDGARPVEPRPRRGRLSEREVVGTLPDDRHPACRRSHRVRLSTCERPQPRVDDGRAPQTPDGAAGAPPASGKRHDLATGLDEPAPRRRIELYDDGRYVRPAVPPPTTERADVARLSRFAGGGEMAARQTIAQLFVTTGGHPVMVTRPPALRA
jgi:hypothetical protein